MVLMGVLRVFEGCCRVFEVCLKNKIGVLNQSDPPPFTKLFHKKNLFFTNDGFPKCDILWELWWFCFCWFWSNVAIKLLDRNPLEHTEVLVGKRERGIFCQKECWRRSTLRAEWVECGLTLEWWPVEERHWQLSIPVPLWRLLILNQPSQLKRHGYWISGLQKVTFPVNQGENEKSWFDEPCLIGAPKHLFLWVNICLGCLQEHQCFPTSGMILVGSPYPKLPLKVTFLTLLSMEERT